MYIYDADISNSGSHWVTEDKRFIEVNGNGESLPFEKIVLEFIKQCELIYYGDGNGDDEGERRSCSLVLVVNRWPQEPLLSGRHSDLGSELIFVATVVEYCFPDGRIFFRKNRKILSTEGPAR